MSPEIFIRQSACLSTLLLSLSFALSPSLSWSATKSPLVSEKEFIARLNVEKMNPDVRLETTVRAAGVMTEILAKWNPQASKQEIFSGLLKGIRNEGIEKGLLAPALQLIDTSMAVGDTKTAAAANLAIAAVNPELTSFIADRLDLPYSDYFASNNVTDESFEKHVTKLVDQAGFQNDQFVFGSKQSGKPDSKPAPLSSFGSDLSKVILGPGSKTAKWEDAKAKNGANPDGKSANAPQAKDIKFSQKDLAGNGVGPLSGQSAESCEATCKDKGMTSLVRDSISVAGLTAVASAEFTPIAGAVVAVVGESWALHTAVKEYDQCVQKECTVNEPQIKGDAGSTTSTSPQPTQNGGNSGSGSEPKEDSATEPKKADKQEKTKETGKTKTKPDQEQNDGEGKGKEQKTKEKPKNESKSGSDFSPDFDRDAPGHGSGGYPPKQGGEEQIDFSSFSAYPGQGEGSVSPAGYPNPTEGPNGQPVFPKGDEDCGGQPLKPAHGACQPNQIPFNANNAFPLQ